MPVAKRNTTCIFFPDGLLSRSVNIFLTTKSMRITFFDINIGVECVGYVHTSYDIRSARVSAAATPPAIYLIFTTKQKISHLIFE